jgi:hypothetical protein
MPSLINDELYKLENRLILDLSKNNYLALSINVLWFSILLISLKFFILQSHFFNES